MHYLIKQALEFHRVGQTHEALALYEKFLIDENAEDPLALYGVASIQLSFGNIGGLIPARKAIFQNGPSELDRSQAAESIVRLLLQHQYQDQGKDFLNECSQHDLSLPNAQTLRQATQLPEYLASTRYDAQLGQDLTRYRPMESAHYVYAIDIVGGCNLRCPTCPVGQQSMPKGLMPLSLYENILDKISNESIDTQPDIWLFNWTEPLLHPQLEDFIQTTHAKGMTTFISTNLNIGHRLEGLMRARPTRLKVSLSSLKQEIYGKTHVRGNIQQVISNLKALAHWRDHLNSQTQIWIGHHLYRNTLEEQADIQKLAQSLGFYYAASPAIVAPIEKVMSMLQDPHAENLDGLRPQLLHDPLALLHQMNLKRSGQKDCELRFNMTAIQFDGQVNLCCASTQQLGSATPILFLENSHAQLEDLKYRHSFCKTCMQANLHLTIPDR